jgi:hypothetical protein
VGEPVEVVSLADFASAFGSTAGTIAERSIHLFFANGGRRAWVVGAADTAGPGAPIDGLAALDTVDAFNILCIPDVADLSVTSATMVIAAASTYAENRSAFFVADPPSGLDQSGVVGWLAANPSLRSPNAALYYPAVQTPDSTQPVPASGAIAGLYARVDRERGVWKAPAGTAATLTGITGFSPSIDDPAARSLVNAGLNPLRTISGAHLVWGARTLASRDGSSEWMYVPVRRLFLLLEASLEAGTSWAVFEPNEEALWARLRTAATTFLDALFRQGAFQGAKADDAYFVRCDRSTMTQSDIDSGHAVMLVGFAPLRPAEFVILTVRLKTAGTADPRHPQVALAMEAAASNGPTGSPGFSVTVAGSPERARDIAGQIAGASGRRLQAFDARTLVSEFIGETEKNLSRLLDVAARRDRVLLFDEADALFGKRTEVSNAMVRAVAEYPGIVVLAARSREDLDPGVLRSANFVLDA